MLQAIRDDLELWRRRGGIQLSDTDRAQTKGCPVGEEDGHFFGCVPGWVRIAIVNNTLWATHYGEGFGTRDGVFLVALLELLARFGTQVPDVDFVLQPGDRAKLAKHPHPEGAKWLPLLLSFAVHPDFQEVGLPDPSFWGWPEMAVPPHWALVKHSDVLPWREKLPDAFWRGGSNRRFGGPTRKALLECPAKLSKAQGGAAAATSSSSSSAGGGGVAAKLDIHDAMRLAAVKNASKPKVCKSACQEWVGPMTPCTHKLAVYAQGEGYTSSKQRLLACGSLPVFLSHDAMDSYFGRWLKPNKHFKALRPSSVCDDLKNVVWWAQEHDAMAERIGVNARRFATRVLGEEMVHAYLLAMLQEVASLMKYKASEGLLSCDAMLKRGNALPAAAAKLARMKEAGQSVEGLQQMVKMTPKTIAARFREREERKGAAIEAALSWAPHASQAMARPHPSSAKYSHVFHSKAPPTPG